MQLTKLLRRTLPAAVLAAAAACGSDGPTAPGRAPEPNFVKLTSDPGDYVGAGQSYSYTQADAVLGVTANGHHVAVRVTGDESWTGDFLVPGGTSQIEPGTYTGLQRYPFQDPSHGGISFTGGGRGCNTITGSLTIDSVRYEAGALAAIEMRFEQHCEGAPTALHGTVHWRAGDTTAPPGPATPVPSGLWQPPAGSTPANGDYVYLRSDPGDYIGGGAAYTYTPASSQITAATVGPRLFVAVGGWSGDFTGPDGFAKLAPGFYSGLHRFPFHNPAKGGLDWSGNGRGCNTLTGWFAVDRVTYSGATITALDLRFEQHCEGGTAALHGAIHIGG